jgi:hypothetical protein
MKPRWESRIRKARVGVQPYAPFPPTLGKNAREGGGGG